jgi:hypothetical protein
MLKPIRMATSKPARQTYLNTILLAITSAILLGVATVAYLLFYMNYIPQVGIVRDVHLQFGYGTFLSCDLHDFMPCASILSHRLLMCLATVMDKTLMAS